MLYIYRYYAEAPLLFASAWIHFHIFSSMSPPRLGLLDVIHNLLDIGANVRARTLSGNLPLHLLISAPHILHPSQKTESFPRYYEEGDQVVGQAMNSQYFLDFVFREESSLVLQARDILALVSVVRQLSSNG